MKFEINYTQAELQKEIWKPIPHYEGIYESSTLGRIRTCIGKTTYTKYHGIRHWKQKILKIRYCKETRCQNRHDGRVELWKDGKHKTYLVSRIIIATFDKKYDLFDSKMTVNHIDGNPLNNRLENLEWCTIKVNIQKSFKEGLRNNSCKKIKLINKITKEEKVLYSYEEAARLMGKYKGYITEKKYSKKNKFENEEFIWQLL